MSEYGVVFRVRFQASDTEDAMWLARLMQDRLDNLTPASTLVGRGEVVRLRRRNRERRGRVA